MTEEQKQLVARIAELYQWEDCDFWGEPSEDFCKVCQAKKSEGHKPGCVWLEVLEMIAPVEEPIPQPKTGLLRDLTGYWAPDEIPDGISGDVVMEGARATV